MTEMTLRANVANRMLSWVGGSRGGSEHREIMEIYNSHEPLARGYKVRETDAYCAATVSAAWIAEGVADWTGTECSCNNLIALAKERGIWQERDDFVPGIGDAILYDWQDTGAGDCVGQAEHVGIVVGINGARFTVAEGNMSGGRIGTREVEVDGRYIRGFICPPYGRIAGGDGMTGEEIYERLTEYLRNRQMPEWAGEEFREAVELGITDGTEPMRLIPRFEAAMMAVRAARAAKEGK